MALQMSSQLLRSIDQLRFEPTAKRVRATVGGVDVVDSTSAALIWEPHRVVPSYAVPEADIHAELVAAVADPAAVARPVTLGDRSLLLDPRTGFGVHTCDGEPLTVHAAGTVLEAAAFRLADPDVPGYVVLAFDAFDGWLEEDEPIVSHPHDPFARIDIRRSARKVRVELDGTALAESSRPTAVFETHLPTRFYLPREDVQADLHPTTTRTWCAYKGAASYWAVDLGGRSREVAWSYESPVEESARLTGLMCFFGERTDYVLDGQRQARPRTPWSDPA